MIAGIKAGCNVRVTLGHEDGSEETVETHNMVTTVGLNLIRDLLRGASTDTITHVAYGTGTTAPADADETLETEVARYALTLAPSTADGVLTYYHYLSTSEGDLGDITELGLLTAATDGTLYVRTVFDAVSKTVLTYIKVEWELTWTDISNIVMVL